MRDGTYDGAHPSDPFLVTSHHPGKGKKERQRVSDSDLLRQMEMDRPFSSFSLTSTMSSFLRLISPS